jgi:hypothetical protein
MDLEFRGDLSGGVTIGSHLQYLTLDGVHLPAQKLDLFAPLGGNARIHLPRPQVLE